MKKIFGAVGIASLLTGCAGPHANPVDMVRAQQVISRAPVIRVPAIKTRVHLKYGNDEALEAAFNQYASSGKAANIITDGFIKFAYNQGQQPIIQTSPLQATVISLEPGERFTNISTGDPNRWSYSVAISGSSGMQQQNVLVKPAQNHLSTNMVITTDRRLYNVKLVSTNSPRATKTASFWYPDEMVNQINASSINAMNSPMIERVPGVRLNNLNFSYKVSCGLFCKRPSWAPVQVFDDGVHTYMQFPQSASNRDLPALFVLENREKELVNFRFKSPYFVVDKLFKRAVLVIGVGNSKKAVTITNHGKS